MYTQAWVHFANQKRERDREARPTEVTKSGSGKDVERVRDRLYIQVSHLPCIILQSLVANMQLPKRKQAVIWEEST